MFSTVFVFNFSPDHLRSDIDLTMRSNVPMMGVLNMHINSEPKIEGKKKTLSLSTYKRNKSRIARDRKGLFSKKLKYRGVRMLPFTQEVSMEQTTFQIKYSIIYIVNIILNILK